MPTNLKQSFELANLYSGGNVKIYTKYIEYENLVFILKKELIFLMRPESDCIICYNKFLNINIHGDTHSKAIEAAYFSFYSLYMNYYLETDKNLTYKAIELKRKLQDSIKEVRKIS